jgi:hypothetical protein
MSGMHVRQGGRTTLNIRNRVVGLGLGYMMCVEDDAKAYRTAVSTTLRLRSLLYLRDRLPFPPADLRSRWKFGSANHLLQQDFYNKSTTSSRTISLMPMRPLRIFHIRIRHKSLARTLSLLLQLLPVDRIALARNITHKSNADCQRRSH